ncbi:MAG TPA: DNA repair exonuclease [Gemmatimonadaceae bacterium]|nr:DNA repair exonuclease [Gemmatimonadaceae bacterium]
MRLVHLADIHLGFRQYQRQTPTGINQREKDVGDTLRRVFDKVIELKPDLVLVAGDVFHAVRPGNRAILHAFNEFSRLTQSLPPESRIVMVAGNHDTPRASEAGSILGLFRTLGITVVEGTERPISVPEHDLVILAVPDKAGGSRPVLEPDPTAKYNILVLHGEIEGILPHFGAHLERAPMAFSQKELSAHKFDYVALGHYHVYRQIDANAYYSGSLDYTSSNAWGELSEERENDCTKGFIEHDLTNRTHRFHQIPPARRWVDLTPVSGEGMSAASLDEMIRAAIDGCDGGIEEKIVRLVVRDVPRHILRELDHKALREYKRRALHFHLDTRRPEIVRRESGQGAPGRRASLADTVREKLQSRPLAENIDRNTLVDLGLHYLREADLVAGPTMEEATA